MTLARLTSFVNQGGAAERLRFTSALSNGKDLYAFRYAVNDRANTLYYRESEQAIVVVSEPLDQRPPQLDRGARKPRTDRESGRKGARCAVSLPAPGSRGVTRYVFPYGAVIGPATSGRTL